MIILHLILHSSVHIHDLHIFMTSSSSFHGFITNQFNDQLPVGLLAQLVEHCTGIAQAFFSQPQKLRIYNCNDHPSFNSIHDRDVMVTFDANEYIRKMIFQ